MTKTACIILGAGKGTRMKSRHPKVMHKVAGRSLLGHVVTAANSLGASDICVVCGPDMANVEAEARKFAPDAKIAIQTDRNGTAKAVEMAREALSSFKGTIVVLYGDVPLIKAEILENLASMVSASQPLSVLGFKAADPKGYGRFIQDCDGGLAAIVEEKDASDTQRKIDMCNSGVMAVSSDVLWELIGKIGNNNKNGEYYLTDLVGLIVDTGKKVGIAVCDEAEVAGINDRAQLAAMEAIFQKSLRAAAMEQGVTLIAPETVFFSTDTKLGSDVVIEPNVFFDIGVSIGDDVTIHANCHISQTEINDGAVVGPYARLRPGTVLGRGSKVGNFVEIKKTVVGNGAKVNHLSYIGDSKIGEKANIGAGTITCNYDGFGKHATIIGAGAFIGSNSSLIAPVEIGDGAYVGSATVVTRDVPADALALARAPQESKEGWAERFRTAKMKQLDKKNK